ncbi:calcium sensing receptor, chloroplastic-like [Chenopodium quinoa]|uniref:Rhodanese domain-containing protein n=1 Tax=Chenopodium quinoa TaxID=63459 RepID=A0A803MXJ4_CHEQI|nr:calcium sensing receptor, chloroplastic-like [Chenopodium quinoa]
MEMMAIKASASTKPTISLSSSSQKTLISKQNSKVQLKQAQNLFFPTSTSLSLLTLFTTPFDAKAVALPKEQLVTSLTQVERTIDQVQEVGSNVLDSAQKVFQVVADALKPGIDAAAPVVQQAGQEALKAASPLISEASKKAQEAMQNSGISSETMSSAAKTVTSAAEQTTRVIEDAKPIASSTVETISNSDPALILEGGAALFLAYLLLPRVWSIVSYNFRGYKGGLTPAQTLDMMCSQNYYLIDIRSEKDKNKAGIPQLPPSAKSRIIAIPLEELPSKLRSLVRNSKKVEAEIVALKISYLKRLSKSTNIVIMDSYSDSAKTVARTLTGLGFRNSWIMADGFSGGKGWLQSRLGTESYNLSLGQIFSPSRIIPGGTGRFGTTSSTVQIGRKLLPE